MRYIVLLLLTMFVHLYAIRTAGATGKVALVIGNSAYEHVSALPNPPNDADDITRALERIGFTVSTLKNLDFAKMRLALRDFSDEAMGADVALVFYAGHGIEVDRQNYLIPVDARLEKDIDVELEAISLDLVNRTISGARGLRLILLDACRDNPFAKSMARTLATRSIGRGLARVEPGVGTLVSYAAKEGTVASDGEGRNSPYSAALIEHLAEPGLEIQFMFRKVRDSVINATNGEQEPFTYGSLPGTQIFLNPGSDSGSGSGDGAKTGIGGVTPPSQSGGSGEAVELAFWNSVKDSSDKEMLQFYLERYPDGIFTGIAKRRIAAIENAAKQPPTPPKQPESTTGNNVASLPPRQRSIHSQPQIVHLGDENIRSWARLWGRCYAVSVPPLAAGSTVRLRYQEFGVEAAYAQLAGVTRSLPPQPKQGKKRPNYWGNHRTIEFNLGGSFPGGELSVCAAPVPNPEFSGDHDDLMLRNIAVEVIEAGRG